MVLKKLRHVLFGQSRHTRDSAAEQPPVARGNSVETTYLLLTRRGANPDEMSPGFPELYYCPKCRDYFVLAWHGQSSALVQQCEVVRDATPLAKLSASEMPPVFCPKCKSDYETYGTIPWPGSPAYSPADVRVYETHKYPFPPDAPSEGTGTIQLGSLIIEKIVLLVAGEFPEEMNVRDFAYGGLKQTVLSRHDAGGVLLHVLRTNTIIDETIWLTALLKKHVYKKQTWANKVFLSYGLIRLRPRLEQALFCLILAQ